MIIFTTVIIVIIMESFIDTDMCTQVQWTKSLLRWSKTASILIQTCGACTNPMFICCQEGRLLGWLSLSTFMLAKTKVCFIMISLVICLFLTDYLGFHWPYRSYFGLFIGTLDSNQSHKRSPKLNKPIEPYFITTCVSSVDELKEIMPRVQHRFSQMNQNKENRMLSTLEWLPSAMNTLFYFMMCSHHLERNKPTHVLWNSKRYLEYVAAQTLLWCDIDPQCNVLISFRTQHGRLPPLTEWMRVAGVHADHRSSEMIDDDDIRQAARLLLPFNSCNYRAFG